MIAQLQPRAQSLEEQQPIPPGRRLSPRSKIIKKKRGAGKRRAGPAAWMKWVASSVGLIATIAATSAAVKELIPSTLSPADPRIEVDQQATLTRSANNQLELSVSLTLLNQGGRMALIPRPTVSLDDASVPPNNLHFKFVDGASEVIFPVPLHEGAATFKQVICSIAEGRNGEWCEAGLLRINLVFKPEGHDPVSRCLVFVPPTSDGNQPVSKGESSSITITDDCGSFGEGFTKRTHDCGSFGEGFTKRTS